MSFTPNLKDAILVGWDSSESSPLILAFCNSYTFASDDDEDAAFVLLDTKAKIGEVKPSSDFDSGAIESA